MRFSALRDRLPALGEGSPPTEADAIAWPRVGSGGASFSDDLILPSGERLAVRVRLTDRPDAQGGGYCVDLRDSDEVAERFAVAPSRVQAAGMLALSHALGRSSAAVPLAAWSRRIDWLFQPGAWIGADDADRDPAAIAFGMARIYDAVLGALAHAWPERVGAGSCSLGAVVELRDGETVVLSEILPGGEGGRPDRPGASAWSGPILSSDWPAVPTVDGVTIEGELRAGSGGGGKHSGGDGVVRRYTLTRSLTACVAFDRVRNPPHGLDRAGPPVGTVVQVQRPGQPPQAIEPWVPVSLAAGSRLLVQTCGGAGWGFPGYGDIEWDPSEWFGSKPEQGE